MRVLHGVICCFSVFVFICSFAFSFVSASGVEDPSIPDPTMDSFSESVSPEQEISSTDPSTGADSGPVLFAAVDGDQLEGLASWSLSTNLGQIHLFVAADFDSSVVRVVDGNLMNLGNSTVYFYCPEFPAYQFSASRFSNVVYRPDSGYNSYELQVNTIEISSVDFIDYEPYIIIAVTLFILFFVIWGMYKK